MARTPLLVVVHAFVFCHLDNVADHVDDVLGTAKEHFQVNRHAQHIGQVEVRDDDQRADEDAARLVRCTKFEEQDQQSYCYCRRGSAAPKPADCSKASHDSCRSVEHST